MNAVDQLLTPNTIKSRKSAKITKNKMALLQAIYAAGKTSINDLMRELSLSFPTLSVMLNELLDQKLILQEERGESIGGRKPNLFQLNHNLFKILTIEITRFTVMLGVLDNNSNLVTPIKTYGFKISKNLNKLSSFKAIIEDYMQGYPEIWKQCSGIAISMPGLVDEKAGNNYTFFYEPDFQLASDLEIEFNKTVRIMNQAKVNCMAEQFFGPLKRKNNALIIQLDWGIGLGIIADGKIYSGKNGFSGEMGHISFKEEGELCYCGKRGCLETIVSGSALVKQAKEDILNGTPTLIKLEGEEQELLPIHIIQAALEGDQYAIQLISSLGNKLGRAIALFIQVFNPETILLTGEFTRASSILSASILQQVQTYSMTKLADNCELIISELGDRSISLGLTRLFMNKYFEERLGLN
ncbi:MULTISPECIES: ROK family protein [Sphingobacterium]|uniref:ROK family protein n=1 Tax=Sphingobacterium tenebrionis TaxID=3111775 RepID=A0ABU8I9A4_9SPHI|nr:ROK family protein [Sphingobacterium sp. CZ-2]QBR13099.1 ROK family protein [Sphingobacterium sp. CZ-2]